ncbi:hypothetical protein HYC85_031498 [Camellia sinensis]|uniref:Uncharacterized protein n=1 Tax=Camellia sinensis TaxID=4442 RepID=A0A7J7FQV5_CAMSI|nr:hypothetical protein HYC85_031498 [Camellia sinensis]
MLPQFLILFLLSISTHLFVSASEPSSIYDVLRSNGLPMGLLPNGVKDFSLDEAGRFVAYLDQECNAKFENELHYDRNVSGTLSYGQIAGLSGISAQDLFLWFPVKEIRVDVPSSGLIYFDVGVVYKQFSLSLFESPRDCMALLHPDLQGGSFIAQTVPKGLYAKLRYLLDRSLQISHASSCQHKDVVYALVDESTIMDNGEPGDKSRRIYRVKVCLQIKICFKANGQLY